MQQTLEQLNPFRISTHKRYRSFDSSSQGISLHIRGLVYNEYKRIDLRKTSSKLRINHRSTVSGETFRQAEQRRKLANGSGQRWQKTLDRYIEAKEKIQVGRISHGNKFGFMKLDKMNLNRRMRMLKESAIPIDIINSAAFSEGIEGEGQSEHEERPHKSSFKVQTEHSRPKKEGGLLRTSYENGQVLQNVIVSIDSHFKARTQQPLSQLIGKLSSREPLKPEQPMMKTHKAMHIVLHKRKVRTIAE